MEVKKRATPGHTGPAHSADPCAPTVAVRWPGAKVCGGTRAAFAIHYPLDPRRNRPKTYGTLEVTRRTISRTTRAKENETS